MATLTPWLVAQEKGNMAIRANGTVTSGPMRRIKKHKPYNKPSPCIIRYDLAQKEDRAVIKQPIPRLAPVERGPVCKPFAVK